MQQRLAIGRAVLHDPEVMLFDEPHTGLDQDASAMLDGVLREVAARGRTVVMTSHDLDTRGRSGYSFRRSRAARSPPLQNAKRLSRMGCLVFLPKGA